MPATFEWNPLRGKDYYYTRIVHDLTKKIGTGIYAAGSYLPYEAQLAKQYGVSAYTIRKALDLMERRGYTKTQNGKGTIVLTPDQLNTEQALQDLTTKQDALVYLHALQLMVLLAHPVAACTAPQFSEDDLEQLAAHLNKPGIALTNLFQMILERLSLKPLQVIWTETSRITEWGFYFAFYSQGVGVIEQLNDITRRAYRSLRTGDNTEFAESLADSYRLILTSVQTYMVEKYKILKNVTIGFGASIHNSKAIARFVCFGSIFFAIFASTTFYCLFGLLLTANSCMKSPNIDVSTGSNISHFPS